MVDDLALDAIKTKNIQAFLDAVSAGKTIFVTPEVNENVYKSARNIPGVSTTTAKILSVYDIVNAKQLVIDKRVFDLLFVICDHRKAADLRARSAGCGNGKKHRIWHRLQRFS